MDYEELGKRIRKCRKRRKWTQIVLADKVGISQHFMCKLQKGKAVLSTETLIGICNALDVRPDYLLSGSIENAKEKECLMHYLQLSIDALDNDKERKGKVL